MSAELVAPGGQVHVRPVGDSHATDAAFDAIYTEHFDRLRRFVLGMTGQATLAEDIAQETLLRAYVRMETFDFDRPLWPWLKTVATRLVFDNARAHKRESLDADPCADEVAACDPYDVTVERPLLAKALRCLPVRQRVAVTLRYLEDWKAAEVADVLGLTRVAAEQLLLRARRRLTTEYLALSDESTPALRVVVWPLLALVAGLRDRLARFRQDLGSTSAQLAMSVEGATQVVAAAAFGGVLLAGGVAFAATPPPDAARAPAAAHATVFHAEDVRAPAVVPAVPKATSQVTRTPSRASHQVKRPPTTTTAQAVPSAAEPTSAPPQPSSKVTRVAVSTPPIDEAPAGSDTGITKERSPEKYLLKARLNGRAGDLTPAAGKSVDADCSASSAVGTACQTLDTAEEALPESDEN